MHFKDSLKFLSDSRVFSRSGPMPKRESYNERQGNLLKQLMTEASARYGGRPIQGLDLADGSEGTPSLYTFTL